MGSHKLQRSRSTHILTDRGVRTTLLITGMRDNACRERVTAALESIPGVREVDVNLYRARAAVVHAPATPIIDLIHAVTECGYGAALNVAA